MKAVIIILAVVAVVAFGRSYPLYKQCDSHWGSDHLGTSSKTICQAGCLMSSAAMALAGTGHSYNPKTLNQWLKTHGGYASGDLFVWSVLDKLGLTYKGAVANSQIKANLDEGHVVICNVHNGAHWVLATGHSGENILVNDPGYSTSSYPLSGIVNGRSGVYSVSKLPVFLSNLRAELLEHTGLAKKSPIAPEALLEQELIFE